MKIDNEFFCNRKEIPVQFQDPVQDQVPVPVPVIQALKPYTTTTTMSIINIIPIITAVEKSMTVSSKR